MRSIRLQLQKIVFSLAYNVQCPYASLISPAANFSGPDQNLQCFLSFLAVIALGRGYSCACWHASTLFALDLCIACLYRAQLPKFRSILLPSESCVSAAHSHCRPDAKPARPRPILDLDDDNALLLLLRAAAALHWLRTHARMQLPRLEGHHLLTETSPLWLPPLSSPGPTARQAPKF